MLHSRFLRVVVLPALLLLLAGLGLGCYYETNDDVSITLLLQGSTAAAPVTDLHLYFHGLARLLAALYQHWPTLPWYGLLLYALLYLATVLSFAVLDKLLRGRLPGPRITVVLVVFFALAWLEHGLWFNYVRVPVLLAGTALLLAAQRPTRRRILALALLSLLLAWLIRPSAALLGVAAAGPGALWLAGRRGASLVGGALALLLLANGGLLLLRTPAGATYRTLDVLKSNLNDYELYRPVPATPADSLGLQAVAHWALGDSTLVNAGLFRRATRLEAGYFLTQVAPHKALAALSLLGRDYFALLVLLTVGGLLVARSRRYPQRRRFWLTQLFFGALLAGLAVGLKLPPRLGMPLFSLWTMTTLIYFLRDTRRPLPRLSPVFFGTLALLLIAYAFKTVHRRQVLGREQARGLAVLGPAQAATQRGAVLVTAGLEAAFKSQSPFQVLQFAPHSVLCLTGWPTLDPSQPALRARLTGTRAQAPALARLAGQPTTQWWLAPEAVPWLTAYLVGASYQVRLQPPAASLPTAPDLPQPFGVGVARMK
ncbi:hypothetical protein [Hymenobacter chitinivorans]|uniref:Dolichyl-phosphate-mannose-protein mannosyltransferase n=1 Tax=Hymenobacter chitinivorans DSM 11115 TaxID=1121954 RepID=A0A2M9BQ66_9BACT|nr:hypothetical protein [Hymenobacter chitinivorans]PJJ60084.1 hypothetical protein CLV45_1509 [Hymenobacter chitinivorans DSM 11115]